MQNSELIPETQQSQTATPQLAFETHKIRTSTQITVYIEKMSKSCLLHAFALWWARCLNIVLLLWPIGILTWSYFCTCQGQGLRVIPINFCDIKIGRPSGFFCLTMSCNVLYFKSKKRSENYNAKESQSSWSNQIFSYQLSFSITGRGSRTVLSL